MNTYPFKTPTFKIWELDKETFHTWNFKEFSIDLIQANANYSKSSGKEDQLNSGNWVVSSTRDDLSNISDLSY